MLKPKQLTPSLGWQTFVLSLESCKPLVSSPVVISSLAWGCILFRLGENNKLVCLPYSCSLSRQGPVPPISVRPSDCLFQPMSGDVGEER